MKFRFLVVKVVFVILFLLSMINTKAQYVVGGDLGTNIPTFNYSSAKVGLGLTITGRYMLSDLLSAGLNVGFSTSAHKQFDDARITIIPVTALVNYYLARTKSKFRPYAGLDLGMYYTISKVPEFTIVKNGWGSPAISTYPVSSESKVKFGTSPVIGGTYAIKKEILIDFRLKYHMAFGGTMYSSLAFEVGGCYLIGRFAASGRSRRF